MSFKDNYEKKDVLATTKKIVGHIEGLDKAVNDKLVEMKAEIILTGKQWTPNELDHKLDSFVWEYLANEGIELSEKEVSHISLIAATFSYNKSENPPISCSWERMFGCGCCLIKDMEGKEICTKEKRTLC